ncbi:hypothetical protein U0070_013663, partial [Myodes glareolus]
KEEKKKKARAEVVVMREREAKVGNGSEVEIEKGKRAKAGKMEIGLPHGIKLSRRRSQSKNPFRKHKSPVREPVDNLTPEERDARTVFCMQLAARIRPRDLEEFFSTVGKVQDVRMIFDRNSRCSKGIAYVEFVDVSLVPLAIGLTDQLKQVDLRDMDSLHFLIENVPKKLWNNLMDLN